MAFFTVSLLQNPQLTHTRHGLTASLTMNGLVPLDPNSFAALLHTVEFNV